MHINVQVVDWVRSVLSIVGDKKVGSNGDV